MKKFLLSVLTVAFAIVFSANLLAQTVGTFTFSFTEAPQSITYTGGAQHALAVWIQTSTGAFIKTKLRYCCGGNTFDHLPTWSVNAGGTSTNASLGNKTDATTGATLSSWATRTFTWDGKNVSGTSNGTLVADGAYKVTIQSTWNHGTGGTVTTSFSFTKGTTAVHLTPANTTNFTGIKLDWVPSVTALTVTTNAVNIKCNGGNTGSATATANGTPPYTYSWSTAPVQTTATATGLSAGTYSVTVKDANSTITTVAVSITQPATALSSAVTNTNASCNTSNGTASVSASGGTGGYTYLWSNGKTTASITGLLANSYSVTVTDANGCTSIGVASVSNVGAPTVNTTPTNASSCSASDGSVTSTVSGGTPPYSYLWSNNKTTTSITGLTTGNYTLTVTDATGCKQITTATVNCLSSSVDAGVNSVANPNGIICSSSFAPSVTFGNFGPVTITSCTINYHYDSNPNQTQSWVGSLAPGSSTAVNLPVITGVPVGAHTFYSSSSNPNGSTDVNTSNDQSQSAFNVTGTTTPLSIPLVEGFESSSNLPSNWILYNPDNDFATWQVVTNVSHTGANCIGFNNCDGDGSGTDMTGTKDRFITASYDFSNATASASLSFDVAYSVLNYKNQIATDSLAVFSSTDCGSTWNQIYLNGGSLLANSTTTLSCWTPSSSDWRTENINLAGLVGQPSVMFAYENRSDWGEWIYVDNINIMAITGIASVNNPLVGFSIYPNPASTSFTIEGVSNAEKIHYAIYSIVGQEIQTGEIPTNGSSFIGKIQLDNISRGMYFIKVSDGKNSWTEKLNIN